MCFRCCQNAKNRSWHGLINRSNPCFELFLLHFGLFFPINEETPSLVVVDKRGIFRGSGRRIRTLTYGVRVRCATFTQSRYVPKNKNYYTGFAGFVNSFFLRDRILFLRALCSLGGTQIGSGEVLL